MRVVVFFVLIGAIIWGAFWYLNRDLDFDRDNPFCQELQAKFDSNEDYSMSYGERVKAVWVGCI